jgi:hypothetical protein
MQDLDFYIKQNTSSYPPPQMLNSQDPDYFMKASRSIQHNEQRSEHRASRLIALVTVWCIGAFTGGLVVGLKFAGGPDKQILDPHTQKAVSDIRSSVSTMIAENDKPTTPPVENLTATKPVSELYPKAEYPFVLRIGTLFSETDSKAAADFLSKKGYTVIMAKQDGKYKLYSGPYKTESEASQTLKKILAYKDQTYYKNAVLLKR